MQIVLILLVASAVFFTGKWAINSIDTISNLNEAKKESRSYKNVSDLANTNVVAGLTGPIQNIPLASLVVRDGFSDKDMSIVANYEKLIKYQLNISPNMTDVDCGSIPNDINIDASDCNYIKTKLSTARFMQIASNGTVEANISNAISKSIIGNGGSALALDNGNNTVFESQKVKMTRYMLAMKSASNANANNVQLQNISNMTLYAMRAGVDINTSSNQTAMVSITDPQAIQAAYAAANSLSSSALALQFSYSSGSPSPIKASSLIASANALKNTSLYTSDSTFKALIDDSVNKLNSLPQ